MFWRVLGFLALIFISVGAFADSSSSVFNPLAMTSGSDASMAYLGQLFGHVGGVLQGFSGQMMGKMFWVYNWGVLSVSGIYITYCCADMLSKLIDGGSQALGSLRAGLKFLKISLGVALVIPSSTTGYSTVQVIVMQVVQQSVALADSTWEAGLDYLNAGGTVYDVKTQTKDQIDLSLVQSFLVAFQGSKGSDTNSGGLTALTDSKATDLVIVRAKGTDQRTFSGYTSKHITKSVAATNSMFVSAFTSAVYSYKQLDAAMNQHSQYKNAATDDLVNLNHAYNNLKQELDNMSDVDRQKVLFAMTYKFSNMASVPCVFAKASYICSYNGIQVTCSGSVGSPSCTKFDTKTILRMIMPTNIDVGENAGSANWAPTDSRPVQWLPKDFILYGSLPQKYIALRNAWSTWYASYGHLTKYPAVSDSQIVYNLNTMSGCNGSPAIVKFRTDFTKFPTCTDINKNKMYSFNVGGMGVVKNAQPVLKKTFTSTAMNATVTAFNELLPSAKMYYCMVERDAKNPSALCDNADFGTLDNPKVDLFSNIASAFKASYLNYYDSMVTIQRVLAMRSAPTPPGQASSPAEKSELLLKTLKAQGWIYIGAYYWVLYHFSAHPGEGGNTGVNKNLTDQYFIKTLGCGKDGDCGASVSTETPTVYTFLSPVISQDSQQYCSGGTGMTVLDCAYALARSQIVSLNNAAAGMGDNKSPTRADQEPSNLTSQQKVQQKVQEGAKWIAGSGQAVTNWATNAIQVCGLACLGVTGPLALAGDAVTAGAVIAQMINADDMAQTLGIPTPKGPPGLNWLIKLITGPVTMVLVSMYNNVMHFGQISSSGDPLVMLTVLGANMIGTASKLLLSCMFGMLIMLGISATTIGTPCFRVNMWVVPQAFIRMVMPILQVFAFILIGIGGYLCIFVPLYPWLIFTFAVIGWFIAVIEGMACAPLICLGLTHPSGQELMGEIKQAAMLLLSIFLRPVLMVIGFIAAIILARVSMLFVAHSFYLLSQTLFQTPSQVIDHMTAMAKSGPVHTGIGSSIKDMLMHMSAMYQGDSTSADAAMVPVNGLASTDYVVPLVDDSWGPWVFWMIALPFLTAMIAYIAFEVLTLSFSLVYLLPENAMRWLGAPGTAGLSGQQIKQSAAQVGSGAKQDALKMGAKGIKSGSFGGAEAMGEGGSKLFTGMLGGMVNADNPNEGGSK